MGLCRLCLRPAPQPRAIFAAGSDTLDKIRACLPVTISLEDELPKNICDVCSIKIDEFYQFRNKAMDSENKLTCLQNLECLKNENIPHILENPNISDWNADIFRDELRANSDDFSKIDQPFTSDLKKDQSALVSVCTQTDECFNMIQFPEIKQEEIENTTVEPEVFDEYGIPFSLKEEPIGSVKSDTTITNELDFTTESVILSPVAVNLAIDLKRSKSHKKSGIKKVKLEYSNSPESSMDYVPKLMRDEFIYSKYLWSCCICFKTCTKKRNMLEHYRSHYSDLTKKYETDDSADSNDPNKKIFECSHCNQIFDSKTLYKKHLSSHIPDRPYKCSLCDESFKEPVEILNHGKKSHSYTPIAKATEDDVSKGCSQSLAERFMCDLCDDKFVFMKQLHIHRHSTHPEDRDRQFINRCMHCRQEFAHLNSLRRHLRSHTGERNYLCYMCGKALSSREHLNIHMRIHTGFKPNVCTTCGKGFVKKCNLVLHERVHSGERPHVCSHCGKAFSQSSTLVIHERYHSGARPYVCTLCNKGFVAKGALSLHLKTSCV